MKHTNICEFNYKGQTVSVLYHKGKLSYTFDLNGNRYGNAVKVEGRSTNAIMSATACLIINYLETYEAAQKHNDSPRT